MKTKTKLPTRSDGRPLTADELLQTDLKNIVRKISAGKVLTRAEREMIQAAGIETGSTDTPTDTHGPLPKRANDKNMRLLIEREFAVSERKAYAWLKKLRDQYWSKTGNWRVADVVGEIQKRKDAATAGPDRDLRREKMALECDILRDRRDRDRGDYIPKTEHRERVMAIVNACRQTVDNWIKTTAAQIGDPVIKGKLEDARRKAYAATEAEYDAQG